MAQSQDQKKFGMRWTCKKRSVKTNRFLSEGVRQSMVDDGQIITGNTGSRDRVMSQQ
jgi:hypothetical protein